MIKSSEQAHSTSSQTQGRARPSLSVKLHKQILIPTFLLTLSRKVGKRWTGPPSGTIFKCTDPQRIQEPLQN